MNIFFLDSDPQKAAQYQCDKHVVKFELGKYWMTEPPKCMPEEFKVDGLVESYRNYYRLGKKNTIQYRWTKREIPEWFQ